MAKSYTLESIADQHGDKMFLVHDLTGIARGRVRFNPRTGDYQGTTYRRGKLVGRYYGTEHGAASWVLKQTR